MSILTGLQTTHHSIKTKTEKCLRHVLRHDSQLMTIIEERMNCRRQTGKQREMLLDWILNKNLLGIIQF